MRSLIFSLLLVGVYGGASNTVNTWNGTLSYIEDWGYVKIRDNANTFWWLYSVQPSNNRPLFLWLQGGPGSSSSGYGNLEELGPKDLDGKDRASTWLQVADLVFVDNPVGAGFSYVDDSSAYTKNVTQIGQDLLAWARAFFTVHPEYRTRPFYIFCESYGGKMSAEFARVIVQNNNILRINFKGVALGDSWISPMDYVNSWGPYLYANSYLDDIQLKQVNAQAAHCQKLVDNQQWSQATNCWGDMEDLIGTVTGGVSWYNILKYGDQDDWSKKRRKREIDLDKDNHVLPETIQRLYNRHVKPMYDVDLNDYMDTVVRQKLGIIPPKVKFGGQSNQVFSMQYGDFMVPNYDTVDWLLKNQTNVIVYNGNLDLICDTIGTEMWVNRLTWTGMQGWNTSTRTRFGTKSFPLAGYVKRYGNFQFWWILRAGHMVAHDTEESSIYMLSQILKTT
ncbi:unnamed protein product, partial [Mesorhabditis belari]|uniref:Retinoid-inducible serine carboxypeptidase n=1 Tax=Mesorhabditis belari TaxID=2138241 RepID=A0AAF3FRT6_9BILA